MQSLARSVEVAELEVSAGLSGQPGVLLDGEVAVALGLGIVADMGVADGHHVVGHGAVVTGVVEDGLGSVGVAVQELGESGIDRVLSADCLLYTSDAADD